MSATSSALVDLMTSPLKLRTIIGAEWRRPKRSTTDRDNGALSADPAKRTVEITKLTNAKRDRITSLLPRLRLFVQAQERIAGVGSCEGFRMTAHRDDAVALGPLSESLQGRNP